jgi:hypothetical protein
MQSCHAAAAVDVAFDEPNLIVDAGLVSVVALPERIGLPDLVGEHVAIDGAANSAGANPRAPACSVIVRFCHSRPWRWRASVAVVWSRRPSGMCRY